MCAGRRLGGPFVSSIGLEHQLVAGLEVAGDDLLGEQKSGPELAGGAHGEGTLNTILTIRHLGAGEACVVPQGDHSPEEVVAIASGV